MNSISTMVQYIHSSKIIEFFFLLFSLFFLMTTFLRIFKYNDDFAVEEISELEKKILNKEND